MDGTAATNIPDFDLPSSTGRNLSLDSFVDKVPLAIAFLTDLETDREVLEALDEALVRFGETRSQVIVVAPIGSDELADFVEQYDITIPILADAEGSMARDFGVGTGDRTSRRSAFVSTADGRMVTRLDTFDETDVVDRLLEEVRDLELGADVRPAEE